MCGIVGITTGRDVSGPLVSALKRLEYRGYDSAGIAGLTGNGIERRRAVGKIAALEEVLAEEPLSITTGIAHTRWATHGRPSVENAHPHAAPRVALVHNGIIENFQVLRDELLADGHSFESQTDTEVVVRLVTAELDRGAGPVEAVRAALSRLHGAFALAFIFGEHEGLLIGARRGAPLLAGLGDEEGFLASDAIALVGLTNRVIYLEDDDMVVVGRGSAEVYDARGERAERPVQTVSVSAAMLEKGNYRHFMLKEIFEQPSVVAQTLGAYVEYNKGEVRLPSPLPLEEIDRIAAVACGTARYAGLTAKYWIETLARVPTDCEAASEFRYRDPILDPKALTLLISQSGETADTLAALRHSKEGGQPTAALTNTASSSMAREADHVFPTYAGPEIGVAATKTFTCQLSALLAFAGALGRAKGVLSEEGLAEVLRELNHVPVLLNLALRADDDCQRAAAELASAEDILFIARGSLFPIAMEGALKTKEISYIHAAGFAAGELKHGPIALIEEGTPIIVLAPSGPHFDKTVSGMQEVIARGGKVTLVTDEEGAKSAAREAHRVITMPKASPLTVPIVYAVAVQLLAYHVAVARGTDVDQPRNLAKSVTVE